MLAALQAGNRGTQACITAASAVSGIIADLDTTIMFATAGTLNRENSETFADHRYQVGGYNTLASPLAQLGTGGRLCPAISHLRKLWTSPKETCEFGLCWQFFPSSSYRWKAGSKEHVCMQMLLCFPLNTPL